MAPARIDDTDDLKTPLARIALSPLTICSMKAVANLSLGGGDDAVKEVFALILV